MNDIQTLELEENLTEAVDAEIVVATKKTSLKRDERGVTMLEYIVLAAILVIAAVAIWSQFKGQVGEAVGAMGADIVTVAGGGTNVQGGGAGAGGGGLTPPTPPTPNPHAP